MSRILKVGMVQQSCGKDIAANIAKLEANIRDCAAKGAQLVVLQELHNSVYFCQTEEAALCDLAEPIPGPSTEKFGALAKELGIVLVLSVRAPCTGYLSQYRSRHGKGRHYSRKVSQDAHS